MIWEAEEWAVRSSAAWGGAKQDDKGEALLALLWAEKDTCQKIPLLPDKTSPKVRRPQEGFQR